MKTNSTVQVRKPCSENWSNFREAGNGRHFESCNRVVGDFTRMSVDEVVQVLRSQSESICGRMRSSQLAVVPQRRTGLRLVMAGIAAMSLLSLTIPTHAQVTQSPASEVRASSIVNVVQGVVVSGFDKSPLPGANILLAGSRIGTTADANGAFRFSHAFKPGDKLIISFIGFKSQEILVESLAEGASITVVLPEDNVLGEMVVMGELSSSDTFSPKQSIWKKIFYKSSAR